MSMFAFNAEVTLSQLPEALTFFKTRRMLCGGVHLFRSHDDEPEKGNQVCIKGLTPALHGGAYFGQSAEFNIKWTEFCEAFNQDCVSFSRDNGETGWLVGPHAEKWLPFNPEYFSPV